MEKAGAFCSMQSYKVEKVGAFCSMQSHKVKKVGAFCSMQSYKVEKVGAFCSMQSYKVEKVGAFCSMQSVGRGFLRRGLSARGVSVVFYLLPEGIERWKQMAHRGLKICFCRHRFKVAHRVS